MARTSRRRFLKLLTAGSAALIAGARPASLPAAEPAKPARARAAARSRAVQAEIDDQKQYVSRTLKAIRDYPLPVGSDVGYTLRPVRPSRGRKRTSGR